MSSNSILVLKLRRSYQQSLTKASSSRSNYMFKYPHSFTGSNNAFNNVPQSNAYPLIQRKFQQGDLPPSAHQNLREFPEWYKPWSLNYQSHGYFIASFVGLMLYGWSFLNDIKESKGRKYRKVHEEKDVFKGKFRSFVVEGLKKGDPHLTKFHQKREVAAHH